MLYLVTGLFSHILLLSQWCSLLLRLQVSDSSVLCIMCDVPSIVVSCSESTVCLTGIPSKFFFQLSVTILVVLIIHFMFHICCLFVHKLLHFIFYSASFCITFLSAGMTTSISKHIFFFLFLIIMSNLFAITSLSASLDSLTVSYLHVHMVVCVYMYTTCLLLLLSLSTPLRRVFTVIYLK